MKLFRWRRWWLVLAVFVGYVIYNPKLLPNEQWQAFVYSWRDRVTRQQPPNPHQLGAAAATLRENILGAYSSAQQGRTIPGLPEEVVVNDAVEVLKDKVKALPADQLRQVKRSFCQDVIDEATAAGNL